MDNKASPNGPWGNAIRSQLTMLLTRRNVHNRKLSLLVDSNQQMPFKLIGGGFMPFWTNHYYNVSQVRFYKLSWKFFAIFKLLIIIRIVKVLSLYRTPGYASLPIHIYLGTFGHFMGGPPHFTEIIAFFWSLTESMMYFNCICRKREDFSWLQIFIFLNKDNIINIPKKLTAETIFLDKNSINKLQRVAKGAFTMSSQYISQIITGFPLIISTLFYFNYNTYNFLVFGLPWAFIWTIWTYCGCLVVYWLPSYFFVFCYYIKLRIRLINQELEQLIKDCKFKSTRNVESNQKVRCDIYVRAVLSQHELICQEVHLANRYWTRYLTLTFLLYTMIICLLLFFLLIATIPWYTYVQYCVVILSGHVILLLIVTYSAIIVWREFRYTYHLLLNAYLLLQVNSHTKLMLMSYIERLKLNRQGFSLLTGHFITSTAFQEVLESIVKYFILVIQYR